VPDRGPPDGLAVEVIHLLFGQPCECRFWFIPRPLPFTPTVESASLAVLQFWLIDILPLLSWELYFTAVQVRTSGRGRPVALRVDFPVPYRGGIITGSESANVTVRVGMQVANPPGDWRSCFFLPGVPKNQVDGNTLSTSWLANLNDVASNLIDRAGTQGWRWVVASRQLDNEPRPVPVGLRVDFVQVLSPWTSQRRKRLLNLPFV
jgi:hypothetical protein